MISVSDGRASTSLPAFAINVQAPANRAPTISGTPPTSVTVGTAYSFTPSASDPDNDTLGYTIAEQADLGGVRHRDRPPERHADEPERRHVQRHRHHRQRRQARPLRSPPFTITVNAAANRAPTISGTPATSVNAGTAYNFQPTGADPDGDTLTYSIQNTPTLGDVQHQHRPAVRHADGSAAGTYSNIVITVSDGKDTRLAAGVHDHRHAPRERQRHAVVDAADPEHGRLDAQQSRRLPHPVRHVARAH